MEEGHQNQRVEPFPFRAWPPAPCHHAKHQLALVNQHEIALLLSLMTTDKRLIHISEQFSKYLPQTSTGLCFSGSQGLITFHWLRKRVRIDFDQARELTVFGHLSPCGAALRLTSTIARHPSIHQSLCGSHNTTRNSLPQEKGEFVKSVVAGNGDSVNSFPMAKGKPIYKELLGLLPGDNMPLL